METKTRRRADKKGRVSLSAQGISRTTSSSSNESVTTKCAVIKAKAVPKRYSLKEMLKHITPETLHDEVDTGPSVGAEEW